MSNHDDEFEALGGVDIKTEIRLTLLLSVFCVGFVLVVKTVAGWIV
jgi:hypothetical protein